MRKYYRAMARANMKRAGIRRINRNFAIQWRKWL